jgi:hypothetical protein
MESLVTESESQRCRHDRHRVRWQCLACDRFAVGCGGEAFLRAAAVTWRDGFCDECRRDHRAAA